MPLTLILFDHGAPRGLRRSLNDHTVYTAREKGWDTLNNGALLRAAEEAGFDLLLTTDQRIRYQQNLQGRRIAILCIDGDDKVVAGAPAGRKNRSGCE